MVEQPRSSNERGPDADYHTDNAPLSKRAGCLAPDADVIRTTHVARSSLMLSSLLAATPEIETLKSAPPPRVARGRPRSQTPQSATRGVTLPI